MPEESTIKVIARIHSEFPAKFGIPRQSGLVDSLRAALVFEPEYRNPEALRGLEDYSHLWLIWEFSEAKREKWSPTVRPPRLGGNTRMGVFATRSPFRPNPIGLSSVRLEKIEWQTPQGPVLILSGADLLDGTPVYDIKPYLPYTDSHSDASAGFAGQFQNYSLQVDFPEPLLQMVLPERQNALLGVLRQDPRPSYQQDPKRVYGMSFAEYEIHFRVKGNLLTVCDVQKATPQNL